MQTTFQCQFCQAAITAEAEMAGLEMSCPNCHACIAVPASGIELGMTLGGYWIERVIGSGGMGVVYLANQLSMHRSVALKVLSPALTRHARMRERFLRETRIAAKLEHPNIVTAFDAGEEAGYCYLAMSYVDGQPLHEVIGERGLFPEPQVLYIVMKVALGLEYAWNTHGLLHRDIKPGNIMLARDGEPKLMDLGLARLALDDEGEDDGQAAASPSAGFPRDSASTRDDEIVGTPLFMSPEQAQSRALDCRSDIYSLGATAYAILCGQPPLMGGSSKTQMHKLLHVQPRPLRQFNPEVTPACETLIMKMLAKDPADRYQNWSEVVRATRRLLERLYPTVSGDSFSAPPQRPSRPAPAGAGPAAVPVAPAATATPIPTTFRRRRSRLWLSLLWVAVSLLAAAILLSLGRTLWSARRAPPPAAAVPGVGEPPPLSPADLRLAAPVPDPVPAVASPAAAPLPPAVIEALHDAEAPLWDTPPDFDSAVARLLQVRVAHPGPQVKEAVEQAMARADASRHRAIEFVMDGLRQQAAAAASPAAARTIYANYAGFLAKDTVKLREEAVQAMDRQAETVREQVAAAAAAKERQEQERAHQTEAVAKAERALRDFSLEIARQVVDRQLAAALRSLDERAPDFVAIPDRYERLRTEVTAAARLPDRLADSFRQQIGKSVSVELSDGSRQLTITGVTGLQISASRQIEVPGGGHGFLSQTFTLSQVGIRDLRRRLDPLRTPEDYLQAALLVWRADSPEQLRQTLAGAGAGPLANAFRDLAAAATPAPAIPAAAPPATAPAAPAPAVPPPN